MSIYKEIVSRSNRKDLLLHICEELSELITAISHHERNRITTYDLFLEMADVEIMLNMLKELFALDKGLQQIYYDKAFNEKMLRLMRIEQYPTHEHLKTI